MRGEKVKTYTQSEIDSKVNILSDEMFILTKKREALNQEIRELRKNIKYYQEMDISQIRLI